MNPKPKIKLCWNCEGRVSFKDENCPFCAVYLHPEANDDDDDDEDSSPPDPPYRVISGHESIIPKAPYKPEEAPSEEKTLPEISTENLKRVLIPLALLLFGSTFLLFGFILLLFSENHVLTLRWDGNIWFVYEILAVPLLFFGWRALSHLKDDEG